MLPPDVSLLSIRELDGRFAGSVESEVEPYQDLRSKHMNSLDFMDQIIEISNID